MNEMVNRVARASYESWRARNPAAKLAWNDLVLSSAHPQAKALLEGLREDARASIAEMRKPTQRQCDMAAKDPEHEGVFGPDEARECWQAMIDEALT